RDPPVDVLLRVAPPVLLPARHRLQVPDDAELVVHLGDAERTSRYRAAILVVRIEKRPRRVSVHGVGGELETAGAEANPSQRVGWRHGRDAHRIAEHQRIDPESVRAYENYTTLGSDHLRDGTVGLRTQA